MITMLTVRRGSLYLDRTTYETYFALLDGLILLRDHDDLLVMPMRLAGAGGYLIKMRNAAGARVVDAADFFRTHGIEDTAAIDVVAVWDDARGALIARELFTVALRALQVTAY